MKTSVSSYSFGAYMSEDRLGYLGIIDKAAELGFDGIEYIPGDYMKIEDSAERIRERASEKGIEVVAFCTGADFLNAPAEAEIERLTKEQKRLESEVERVEKKLANKGFTDKAPAKLVEEERAKGEKYRGMLETVIARLESLKK